MLNLSEQKRDRGPNQYYTLTSKSIQNVTN